MTAGGPRILVVAPAFLAWDLGVYVTRLLAARDTEVRPFAYRGLGDRTLANQRLLDVVADYRPDIVLGLKMGLIEPDTVARLRDQGVVVLLWYVDCFTGEIPDQIARLVPVVSAVLTSAKGMLPKYAALSQTPAYWVYEGVYLPAFSEVEVPEAQRGLYGSQIAFIGNVFHPPVADETIALHRYRLLTKVCSRFELKVWGGQGDPDTRQRWQNPCPIIEWPAYHEELVKICTSTAIVLGTNTVNDVELYFSNRTFLTLACGGFHLTHYVPALEEMFTNHHHLVWFHSDEECLDLIDFYLARPDERRRIAAEGKAWVRAHYGMERQVDGILAIGEGLRGR